MVLVLAPNNNDEYWLAPTLVGSYSRRSLSPSPPQNSHGKGSRYRSCQRQNTSHRSSLYALYSRSHRPKNNRKCIDVISDASKFAIQPNFRRHNFKPKEALFSLSIVEDLFFKKYLERDKISVKVIFLTDNAHVWYDIVQRDWEGHGLHPIRRWKDFKELFLEKFLPFGFQSPMHSKL